MTRVTREILDTLCINIACLVCACRPVKVMPNSFTERQLGPISCYCCTKINIKKNIIITYIIGKTENNVNFDSM